MLSENTTYDVELPEDLREVLNDYPHMVFTEIEVKLGRPVEIHCQFEVHDELVEPEEDPFKMIRGSIRRKTNFNIVDRTSNSLHLMGV